MGYTYDTQMSQFIPPSAILKSAGTWTESVSSNVARSVRTAAAAAFTLAIPVLVPSNAALYKGVRVKSIDLFWLAGTADFTDVNTVGIDKVTLPANAVAAAGAAVTAFTLDGGNDTNAKRLTQASHTMTLTLTGQPWIKNDEAYYMNVIFNAAAGTVFTLFGARVNYELRV